MRLKTFTAPSMNEAMQLVKTHLGSDAIIVSTQKGEGGLGVRVTAAMEAPEEDDRWDLEDDGHDPMDEIVEALTFHNVPAELSDKLTRVAGSLDVDDAKMALAGALDQQFKFQALPVGGNRPIVLVGMPGAGKTVTTAKLATRQVMKKKPINVITTDTVRAGGFDQLEAFTRLLKVPLHTAGDADTLNGLVREAPDDTISLIDCAGGNPFDEDDLDDQRRLIHDLDAEIVLVMAAGADPLDAADQARAYASIGARRLLATRLDIARRLGGVLAAADAGRLTFAEVGIGSSVADGLGPLNPVSLARLLLPNPHSSRLEAAD